MKLGEDTAGRLAKTGGGAVGFCRKKSAKKVRRREEGDPGEEPGVLLGQFCHRRHKRSYGSIILFSRPS